MNTHQPLNYIKLGCSVFPNPVNILGNLSRNSVIGPGLSTLDTSLFKETHIQRISSDFVLQTRVEVFNILNHPNFAAPLDHRTVFDALGLCQSSRPDRYYDHTFNGNAAWAEGDLVEQELEIGSCQAWTNIYNKRRSYFYYLVKHSPPCPPFFGCGAHRAGTRLVLYVRGAIGTARRGEDDEGAPKIQSLISTDKQPS